MHEVLAHAVRSREGGLHRHELGPRVPDECHEEQPGIEATQPIIPVGERVATAQQADSAVRRRMREANMGRLGDGGSPRPPRGSEVGVCRLATPGQRAPFGLGAADDVLCSRRDTGPRFPR